MRKKKSKLQSLKKRYCSCLFKLRKKKSLKKKKPFKQIKNPYAICTHTIFNLQNKKKLVKIDCK